MTQQNAVPSTMFKARMAGLFYLLTFITGGVAQFAAGNLIVDGNAAATASAILAHQPAFRLGFAAYLLVVMCYIAVTGLFYDLFKHVNRTVSLIAALFSTVGCAIQAVLCIFLLAPFVLLGGAQYLAVFSPGQLQALTLMFLNFYGQGWAVCFAIFGVYCFLIGWLIFKSTFLPRALGVLMMIAGVAWATFLWPPFAGHLAPYNMGLGVLGEGSLTLWLLVKGVNIEKWRQQADTDA